jgi:hypothetical protein
LQARIVQKYSRIKQKNIKCGVCSQEYQVKDNEFKSIEILKKQIDDCLFLSDEEFALKKQIEDSIRTFYQMYEDFTLNKTTIDLGVHEHSTEIRFKLDEHEVYMEMIEKTKKFEATYLKSLEDKLEASLRSFETNSVEQSLKETEEEFRNPNLLIDSIKGMQRHQEEAIRELKLKLNEQSHVKESLIRMNEFTPNVSFIRDLFGPNLCEILGNSVKKTSESEKLNKISQEMFVIDFKFVSSHILL